MKSWVKLYTEINWDPKIGTLSWAHRGLWCSLLALAGEIDARDGDESETGELDTIENTAWRLRCDPTEFREMLAAFLERGIIAERNGILFVTHYGIRQAVPPSQTRPANRDRQREHRMSQVSHNTVTTQNRIDPDPDPDPDPEVGAVAPAATPPPGVEEPNEGKNAPKRRDARTDPRSKAPAIQCVRGVTGHYPPREMYEEILCILGENPDGAKLANCRHEWIRRGYNPAGWPWLTEWYANGISPPNDHRGNGRVSGKSSTEMLDDWYEQEKRKEAARAAR